nr:immunoglobulin light chain junction region [Macaca mulatta]
DYYCCSYGSGSTWLF